MIFYYLLFNLYWLWIGGLSIISLWSGVFLSFTLNKRLIFLDLGKAKKIYMCRLEIILACSYLDTFAFSRYQQCVMTKLIYQFAVKHFKYSIRISCKKSLCNFICELTLIAAVNLWFQDIFTLEKNLENLKKSWTLYRNRQTFLFIKQSILTRYINGYQNRFWKGQTNN